MSDGLHTKTPDVRDTAPGVRQVAVGEPFLSYAYLINSPEGIVAFDAGVRGSGPEILAVVGGPIAKVILSHAHADHRAPDLGAPIYCHPDEVADAQADWPQSYLDFSLIQNQRIPEGLYRLNQTWDGDRRHDRGGGRGRRHASHPRPGHAPGEIALFRASDRLLLAADAIYTQDAETGDPGPARVPNHFATGTPSKRARRSASSPPTSPRASGSATRPASPATSRPNSRPPLETGRAKRLIGITRPPPASFAAPTKHSSGPSRAFDTGCAHMARALAQAATDAAFDLL